MATGAIAHGVLVAEALDLPFVYIRSSAKAHGLSNQIEGSFEPNQKFVVVEDLISTGGSSLNAVKSLRDANCEVLGMMAIFTYGFPVAVDNFLNASCTLDTLSNYNVLIELAAESGYISEKDLETLKKWRLNPDKWTP